MDLSEKNNMLSKKLIVIMSITGGISVANIYYIQPLLNLIANSYQVTQSVASLFSVLTQIGYALGLLLILPLADIFEKKQLIITMSILSSIFLLLLSLSKNVNLSIFASFGIGFFSVIPQLILPLSMHYANPAKRGEVIGSIMTGLLIGILLSRVLSGLIAQLFGWRTVYIIAFVMMLGVSITISSNFPKTSSKGNINYIKALTSLVTIFKKYSVLREASIVGSMGFLAFSTFWTSLTFLLQSSVYDFSTGAIGLFGFVGIVGALFSKGAGKISDKKGARFTVGINLLIILFAFLIFILFGYHLWGLILGVIFLDLGVQSSNISNQTRIHEISESERNRITSIYMVFYFLGGSLGSWLASIAFENYGWVGACFVGIISQVIALIIFFHNKSKKYFA